MELTISKRRVKLIVAVIVMLFAGVIYAWSITKTPFMIINDGVAQNTTLLGVNYTLTIIFFCLGGFIAGLVSKYTTITFRLVVSALLLFTGFFAASVQTVTFQYTHNYLLLFMAYGMLCGLGLGMAYVTVISTVNLWFPDKKGFASGFMLMGFGFSMLLLGSVVDYMGSSEAIGWRATYVVIAIALGVVLLTAAIFIKPPPKGTVFPEPKAKKVINRSDDDYKTDIPGEEPQRTLRNKDFEAREMIRRSSFVLIFIYITILATSGSAAISFATDIIIDVGATERFAVIAVGMLGVSNGIGRLVIGWLFDRLGLRKAQFISSVTAILAPLTVVLSLITSSLILGVTGLCLCGFSYGFAPTTSSVFTSEFYGTKNFPLNFSIMNLILIPAPFAAMLAGGVKSMTGGFMPAFIILTVLTVAGFFINLAIRKP